MASEKAQTDVVKLNCTRGSFLPPYMRSHLRHHHPLSDRSEDQHLALMIENGFRQQYGAIMSPANANPVGRFLSRPEVRRTMRLMQEKQAGLRFYLGSSALKREIGSSEGRLVYLGLWSGDETVLAEPTRQTPLPENPDTWVITPALSAVEADAPIVTATVYGPSSIPIGPTLIEPLNLSAITHFDRHGLPAID